MRHDRLCESKNDRFQNNYVPTHECARITIIARSRRRTLNGHDLRSRLSADSKRKNNARHCVGRQYNNIMSLRCIVVPAHGGRGGGRVCHIPFEQFFLLIFLYSLRKLRG